MGITHTRRGHNKFRLGLDGLEEGHSGERH